MPYVKKSHRTKLDPAIADFSEDIAKSASTLQKPEQIGEVYFVRISEVVKSLKQKTIVKSLVTGRIGVTERLAQGIVDAGAEDGSFWAGDLNYALTRVIQLVPRKLVVQKKWDREFRYWVYAVTAGALEKVAMELNKHTDSWIDTVIIGVLFDVKDEYKRRVNAPYENEQISFNGDAYDVEL